MDQNPTIPTPLPVLRIIFGAFQFVWNKKWRMAQALLIPATAIFILKLSTQQTYSISSDPGFSGHALWGWSSFLIQTALYALFAITCHRLVLTGDHSVPDYGVLAWTQREWRYLGWAFVVLIVWMLYSFVVNSFYVSAIIKDVEAGASVDSFESTKRMLNLMYIPLMYLFCRLSVLYPAIAVDREVTAQWAWRFTVHNGLQLAVIVGLFPFALYLLMSYLARDNATFLENVILQLIGFILLAVEIVALSFSYKHLARVEQ